MRLSFLIATACIGVACSDSTLTTAPDSAPRLAKGGKPGSPAKGNIVTVSLGFSGARDIDEQGRIAGFDFSSQPIAGVLWVPAVARGTTGSTTNLGTLGGDTYALGLNDEPQVTGGSTIAGNFRGFVWEGGTLHEFAEPEEATGSIAEEISNPLLSGERLAVGVVQFTNGRRPAAWRVSGSGGSFAVSGPDLLPGSDGADVFGQALAVNGSELVVGDVWVPGSRPAKWSRLGDGWIGTELPLLPGHTRGQALDVNASGNIVGTSDAPGTCTVGVVWAAGSAAPFALPDLRRGTCSVAWAINDAGHITGNAKASGGFDRAVLWVPDGGGGYAVLQLTRAGGSSGYGLNEPQIESGANVVEVAGTSGGATLWKVTLP